MIELSLMNYVIIPYVIYNIIFFLFTYTAFTNKNSFVDKEISENKSKIFVYCILHYIAISAGIQYLLNIYYKIIDTNIELINSISDINIIIFYSAITISMLLQIISYHIYLKKILEHKGKFIKNFVKSIIFYFLFEIISFGGLVYIFLILGQAGIK